MEPRGPQAKRTPSTFGIIVNAVAIVAAIAAAPYLLGPLIKLGFVGFLAAAPFLLLGYTIAFVVIDVGPVIGLITSALGVARWLGRVTGPLSLASLVVLIAVVAALKTQIDLDGDGHNTGVAPKGCKPAVANGDAVGRQCDSGTAYEQGTCPTGYFCSEELAGQPESLKCKIQCTNDCECPDKLRCYYGACVKR